MLKAFLLLGDTAKPATRTHPCSRRPIQTWPEASHVSFPCPTGHNTEVYKSSPGTDEPLLQATCGLHSCLNPSSRNVPASVKSGPSSSVWSRQSPADATCSALVRTARSKGEKLLGRKHLPSRVPAVLP